MRHPSFAAPQFSPLYYIPGIPQVSQRAGTPGPNLVQQNPNITSSNQQAPMNMPGEIKLSKFTTFNI